MDPADPDDVAADAGPDAVAGTVQLADGRDLPVALSEDIVEAAQQADDVDLDDLKAAVVPEGQADGSAPVIDVSAQSDGNDGATIPVQDTRQHDLTSRYDREFDYIQDPQIRKLQRNSVNYSERVGKFLLARDDLIPSVKERIKALIIGEDGLSVAPADPDDDADQKLAQHLRSLYEDDIRPEDVVDTILRENLMNARAVLRATDLAELDLATLTYLKDGVSGEEIYVQSKTTVYEFNVDDDGDGRTEHQAIDLERREVDAQPLVIGEQVFDISLYDTPPLEAVADTAVNKMVMQRLKARKAEITSFGAVYASVQPPSWLPEEEYFDRVKPENYDGDGNPPTKLEQSLKQGVSNAFDTLKDFQSGTVMSVPDSWNLEQLEVPENNETLDQQIRGYNRDISRRMLVPLDLLELREGSEMSRQTLFKSLLTTIAGWRREILRIFDQFAAVQADIHGLGGDVEHNFPPLHDEDPNQIIKALRHAGVAGLTEKEVRQMMNNIEGVDLDVDNALDTAPDGGPSSGPDRSGGPQDGQGPPDGGPDDPQQRADAMQGFLEDQRRGQQGDQAAAADAQPGGGTGNRNPAAATAKAKSGTDTSTRTSDVFDGVPPIPEGTSRLSKDALILWVSWVRAGQPELEARRFNPSLHPRDPRTGKFVERPWSIPDDLDVDSLRRTPTVRLLEELADAGEPVDDVLASGDVSIDGIPDDVDSIEAAKERLGGDRLVFQDIEDGDQVEIVDDDTGALTKGQVLKTEQIDGGYNRVHVESDTGTVHVAEMKEGMTVRRPETAPVQPTHQLHDKPTLGSDDLAEGMAVDVREEDVGSDAMVHATTGVIEETGEKAGQDYIKVNGTKYAPDHDMIEVREATAETLGADDVEEGLQVNVFDNGDLVDSGEVTNVMELSNGATYVDIDDGGTQPVKYNDITPQGAVPPDLANDPASAPADASDALGPDDFPDDQLGLDDIDPGQIEATDLQPGHLDKDVTPGDVEPGDWIRYGMSDDPASKVGRVSDVSSDGIHVLVDDGDGAEEISMPAQDILQGVTNTAADPDPAENIDPSTVSATAVNSSKLTGTSLGSLQEGDWVAFRRHDDDSSHIGQVSDTSDDTITKVKTGHDSDPQALTTTTLDNIWTVDHDTVADIGDKPGQDSTSTQSPDAPDPAFDADQLADQSAHVGTDVQTDDLNHPVTHEGPSAVGILDADTAQAFREFAADPDQGKVDLTNPATSTQTKYADMTYPQANHALLKRHVRTFMDEHDGLPDASGFGATDRVDRLYNQIGSWKGKSYTDIGQGIEKSFHAALDLPGGLRNDGLDGDEPDQGDAVAAALLTAATQQFFRENASDIETRDLWGPESDAGEMPLYRGVGKHAVSSLARDWLEDPNADAFTVEESKIGNFSNDPELADSWGENNTVIKKNATVEDIVFSPDVMTGPETGIATEGEIWLAGGVSKADPDQIQVKKKGDGSRMTMADMKVKDIDKLDGVQDSTLRRWLRAMDKRDEPLTSQTQIERLEQYLDAGVHSGSQEAVINRILDNSRAYLDPDRSTTWEPNAGGVDA